LDTVTNLADIINPTRKLTTTHHTDYPAPTIHKISSAITTYPHIPYIYNLPGGKEWLVHKADNLTTICYLIQENVGASTSHNHMGLHRLLQG
jgi:hypothetical protein